MARRKASTGGGIGKYIVMMIFAAALILGVFLMISRPFGKKSDEDNMVLNKVQRITTDNLEMYYPENERKVVSKYYEIMEVMYEESYSDEELTKMIDQLSILYDDELLMNQMDLISQMKDDVDQKKKDGYSIVAYNVPSDSDDVTFFNKDGRSCAGMEVSVNIRNGTHTEFNKYTFILRKDDTGKWKILGWQLEDKNG